MDWTSRPPVVASAVAGNARATAGALTTPRLRWALKAAAAAVLVTGAGMSHAAAVYSCSATTNGGGSSTIAFSAVGLGDTFKCGDKELTVNSFDFGGNTGQFKFDWTELGAAGYADDIFRVRLDFDRSLVGPEAGFFGYGLKILDASYHFDTVQLDSTVAPNANSSGSTSVQAAFAIGPTLTSLDGAPVGPVELLSPSEISVRNSWNVVERDLLNNFETSYIQAKEATPVSLPGTLSLVILGLVGVGAARRKQA
jgi:hypothetical protein